MKSFFGKSTFGKVEGVLSTFGGILIAVLMMLTVIDVTGRYLFRHPLKGSAEGSELLLVMIVMLAVIWHE